MTVVKVNTITVNSSDDAYRLEKRFTDRRHEMDGVPGLEPADVLRPAGHRIHDTHTRYLVVTRWTTDNNYCTWLDRGRAEAATSEDEPLHAETDLLEYDLVDLDRY